MLSKTLDGRTFNMIEKMIYTGSLKFCIGTFILALVFSVGQNKILVKDESCCPKLSDERWNKHQLYEGIEWKYAEFVDLFGSPQYLNLIISHADTLAKRIVFAAADNVEQGERRMRPSEFARHYSAMAAVNAGFFTDHPDNLNTGVFKWEGSVYPFLKRESDEIYFVGEGAIGISLEGEWLFYSREGKTWPNDWPDAHSAIAGGHSLIEEGSIRDNILDEEFITDREIQHAGQRHPRTAVCLAENNHILILVADGRHNEAVGFSLYELAQLLQEFGCINAINLDGGGSSTMFIRGEGVVNHPSDNGKFDRQGERAVRTVIVITEPEQKG